MATKIVKPNKNQKIVLQVTKTCICIVKAVKNTQVARFQKILVLTSEKKKVKGKSKCAIYHHGYLSNYQCFKDHYNLIAVDLSKQNEWNCKQIFAGRW